MDTSKLNLVTIGGGKGHASILSGLIRYSYRLDINAIVSMVDDGGSTGIISQELGIPPFGGDFKDVLTALSHNKTMVDLWQHRYERASQIKGHTVGNLILIGLLEAANWDMARAIDVAREMLDIQANVYPSTTDKVALVAEYNDGEIVEGQDAIDNNLEQRYKTIVKAFTKPTGNAYPEAVSAIEQADAIVLTPGDMYGSLICNLVIPGIKQAIKRNKQAKLIYITNLMTKVNQTHGWAASRFIDEVNKYTGRPVDIAIVNNDMLEHEQEKRKRYSEEHWEMVETDIEADAYKGVKVVQDRLWYEGEEFKRVSSDVIPRSFIRHDPAKIAELIMGLIT